MNLEKLAEQQSAGECFATDSPNLINRARRLMAREYLRRKFISNNDIDKTGTLKPESDPYAGQSTYYVMTTPDGGDVAATVRTIHYDSFKEGAAFPLLEHEDELFQDYVDDIHETGYENIVEISALVRDRDLDVNGTAAMKLYKKLFLDAWSDDKDGKSTFIMACSPVLFKNFQLLFDGSMKRIGPDLPYPGQEVVPAMFSNRQGGVNIVNMSHDRKNPYNSVYKGVVEYFLAGSDASKIHPDILQALADNGYDKLLEKMTSGDWGDIDAIEQKAMRSIKKSAVIGKIRETAKRYVPEIVAGAGLTGYTALRTVAVAKGISPVSDVDWGIFLGVELATTPQYVWGVGDLVRGAGKEDYPTKRKLGAFALASSAFVAPYAYIAAEGGITSEQGVAFTGGLLALGVVPTVAKAVKKRIKRKQTSRQ